MDGGVCVVVVVWGGRVGPVGWQVLVLQRPLDVRQKGRDELRGTSEEVGVTNGPMGIGRLKIQIITQ